MWHQTFGSFGVEHISDVLVGAGSVTTIELVGVVSIGEFTGTAPSTAAMLVVAPLPDTGPAELPPSGTAPRDREEPAGAVISEGAVEAEGVCFSVVDDC